MRPNEAGAVNSGRERRSPELDCPGYINNRTRGTADPRVPVCVCRYTRVGLGTGPTHVTRHVRGDADAGTTRREQRQEENGKRNP